MNKRWTALAVLFVARLTMAFQFQTVGAVAPLLQTEFGASHTDIGFLVGLYLVPGVGISIAGSAIGRRFGDSTAVGASFLLLIAGGIISTLVPGWSAQVLGRLVAGGGGVMLSVVMTKMVADWFPGRELATAMAIFINSWPAGMAVALIVLPPIGVAHGPGAVFLASTVALECGFLLFAALYRDPPAAASAVADARPNRGMNGITFAAVVAASLIWAFYNIALVTIFTFGPTMLGERGYSAAAAGLTVSVVLWLSILSVPAGGLLADRIGRTDLVIRMASFAIAGLLAIAAQFDYVFLSFALLGLAGGLPAGAILNLPARLLRPENRAIGMGTFYTIYYGGIVVGTAVAGHVADWAGTARATFDFGAVLIAVCPLLLLAFQRLEAGSKELAAAPPL